MINGGIIRVLLDSSGFCWINQDFVGFIRIVLDSFGVVGQRVSCATTSSNLRLVYISTSPSTVFLLFTYVRGLDSSGFIRIHHGACWIHHGVCWIHQDFVGFITALVGLHTGADTDG